MTRSTIIAFLLTLATCNPLPAWADVMEDRAILLARVCTNETSWNLTDDCAAIYETIRHKADARGVPFERFIRSHNHRTMSLSRTQRRWIAYLRDDRRPAHWPRSTPWNDYLPLWRARLQHARDIIAGNEASQCEETPWTWGSPQDRWNARRMHLRKIDCGITLNDFYVLPR